MEWHLTDKRREDIVKQLMAQSNVSLIAMSYGICRQTLSKKLKEADIDVAELQKDGIRKLRLNLYHDLVEIDDPKDRAKMTLDVLKHYDQSDDVASAKQSIDANVTVEKCYLPLKNDDN